MDALAVTAAKLLSAARRVVVLTGAGMSRESGVPTFRDALTGLWARFDPEELATEAAFRRNPSRVFGWYLMRLRTCRSAEPHAGYRALPELAGLFEDFLIVTQNVDGLHQRAGSRDVVELHGSLESFRCLDGGHSFDVSELELQIDSEGESVGPPACSICGSPIRPGVVWFGEALPEHQITRAWRGVEECEAALVVGTSSVVYPAAELPLAAAAHGAKVVEINPNQTPLSAEADVWWPATAAAALPALTALMKEGARAT